MYIVISLPYPENTKNKKQTRVKVSVKRLRVYLEIGSFKQWGRLHHLQASMGERGESALNKSAVG